MTIKTVTVNASLHIILYIHTNNLYPLGYLTKLVLEYLMSVILRLYFITKTDAIYLTDIILLNHYNHLSNTFLNKASDLLI